MLHLVACGRPVLSTSALSRKKRTRAPLLPSSARGLLNRTRLEKDARAGVPCQDAFSPGCYPDGIFIYFPSAMDDLPTRRSRKCETPAKIHPEVRGREFSIARRSLSGQRAIGNCAHSAISPRYFAISARKSSGRSPFSFSSPFLPPSSPDLFLSPEHRIRVTPPPSPPMQCMIPEPVSTGGQTHFFQCVCVFIFFFTIRKITQ